MASSQHSPRSSSRLSMMKRKLETSFSSSASQEPLSSLDVPLAEHLVEREKEKEKTKKSLEKELEKERESLDKRLARESIIFEKKVSALGKESEKKDKEVKALHVELKKADQRLVEMNDFIAKSEEEKTGLQEKLLQKAKELIVNQEHFQNFVQQSEEDKAALQVALKKTKDFAEKQFEKLEEEKSDLQENLKKAKELSGLQLEKAEEEKALLQLKLQKAEELAESEKVFRGRFAKSEEEKILVQDKLKQAKEKAEKEYEKSEEEKVALREKLRKAKGLAEKQLEESEEELKALKEQLQEASKLAEKQKQDLSEAQTRAVSTASQGDEMKSQVALERSNAIKYKGLYDTTRTELNILKDQLSSASSLEDTFQQELFYAKTQADERLFEINQLKSLISQLDQTQNKLVGKLKLTIAELEETKRAKKEIEDVCTVQDEATSEFGMEVSKLKSIIKSLDSEKDKIQNELDSKCEAMRKMEESVETQSMELHSAKIELTNSQIKIRDVEKAFRSFKDEYDSILRQCKKLHADNKAMQSENSNAQQEINALSEDMTQMAREQQIVNADLVKAVNQRNNLQDEVQVLRKKTLDQEKILEMKFKEIKEYTLAYKELGADNQQVLAKIADLEREVMEKNALIVTKDSEIRSMENIVQGLEIENRKAIADLTSYEAATSELSSALTTAEDRINKDSRVKIGLMETANISKQNALQMEDARRSMQNEVYRYKTQMQNSSSALGVIRDENDNLRVRLAQQNETERNLEAIIEDLRKGKFVESERGEMTVDSSEVYRIELEKARDELDRVNSEKQREQQKIEALLSSERETVASLLQQLEERDEQLVKSSQDSERQSSAQSTPTSGGKSPKSKLLEQLQAVKQENLRLRSNLEATQATVGKMGAEITRVRAEYQAVVEEFTGLGDE